MAVNQKHDTQLAKIFETAAKTANSPADREKAADALNKFLKQLEVDELK